MFTEGRAHIPRRKLALKKTPSRRPISSPKQRHPKNVIEQIRKSLSKIVKSEMLFLVIKIIKLNLLLEYIIYS